MDAGTEMRVTVVIAWPDRHASVELPMADGATVGDAVAASRLPLEGIAGYAIHGTLAEPSAALRDGDRVELLRPLQLDPKEARRRRARGQGGKPD